MTWLYPWAIAGVSEISLSVARVLAYAATGARNGIIDSDDLKVTATTQASATINVSAGAFVAVNRFTPNTSESYIGVNNGPVSTTVPATTSAARSDLVYAHIIDPGQPGQPATAGPIETRVITNVASNTTRIEQVASLANQSGYAIARIDRPANSSTVTQAQIIDLRELAVTFNQTEFRTARATSSSSEAARASSSYSPFPPSSVWQITVPTWANKVSINYNIANLELRMNGSNTDSSFQLNDYVVMSSAGPGVGGGTTISTDATANINKISGSVQNTAASFGATAGGDIAIPVALRGTSVYVYVMSQQPANSNIGVAEVNGTNAQLQLVFKAVPE